MKPEIDEEEMLRQYREELCRRMDGDYSGLPPGQSLKERMSYIEDRIEVLSRTLEKGHGFKR